MALSSDEIIKREIADTIVLKHGIRLRIFPESSNDDQVLFSEGGLTFGIDGCSYGSCDACWYTDENWKDGFDGNIVNKKPIIALEGTDALNRKSSGNAQYQRFHHALGAVKNGLIGIYYLRKGSDKIQEDLFGMAYNASKIEKGDYLIVDDLQIVQDIIDLYDNPTALRSYIDEYLEKMYQIFKEKFEKVYNGSWQTFSEKRSTIIEKDYVIKYAGRMRRNFTDSSQRAGHIAVGEMYLTKYYFNNKKVYYLFPKMTKKDLLFLDNHKGTDKEWFLLRHEPNVQILTMDDLIGLSDSVKSILLSIQDEPLKGDAMKKFNHSVGIIWAGLRNGSVTINHS